MAKDLLPCYCTGSKHEDFNRNFHLFLAGTLAKFELSAQSVNKTCLNDSTG